MSRKGSSASSRSGITPASAKMLVVMTAAAVGLALLALFQWMELIVAQHGGDIACSVTESLDCAAVWASPFAKKVHGASRMPLAGWGLVYGLAAIAVCLRVWWDALIGSGWDGAIQQVRLHAVIGAVVSFILLLVSWQFGAFCLTCMGTYTLVVLFAAMAFMLPPSRAFRDWALPGSLVPLGIYVAVGFLALLPFGMRTPLKAKSHIPTKVAKADPPATKAPPPATKAPPPAKPAAQATELGRYLAQLPVPVQKLINHGVREMSHSKTPDVSRFKARVRFGPENAKVKIVDFVDMRCPHCAQLEEAMGQIKDAVPPGSFSLEPRFFPLDSGCNPEVQAEMKDPTNVRCLGPQVLVCLEEHESYWTIRNQLFKEQDSLSAERIYQIATTAKGVSKASLKKCASSKATAAKLKEDIDYATLYGLEGTPMVLINGRKGLGLPAFVYVMINAEGRYDLPEFKSLPEPDPHTHAH